jgi:hypothetical protein
VQSEGWVLEGERLAERAVGGSEGTADHTEAEGAASRSRNLVVDVRGSRPPPGPGRLFDQLLELSASSFLPGGANVREAPGGVGGYVWVHR